jgi:predicted metalloprotease
MLWQGRRQSSNVEDRRGIGAGGLAVGGGCDWSYSNHHQFADGWRSFADS